MKLSVVIAAYNYADLLKFTLASLEKQDLGVDNFEVIVIDDGSTDGTGEIIRNYPGELNLLPFYNSENKGRAKTRNIGIEAAGTPLVVFLDADMEVDPDFLRLHLEAQRDGEQVSVGKVVFHPSIPKSGLMRYLEKRGAFKLAPGAQVPGKYFLSCNASVPTGVLLDVGGFDESFIHYGGEDIDLGLRLAEKIPLRSLPSALSRHRHYRDLHRFLQIVRGYGRHSLPYLLKKHPGMYGELKLDQTSRGSFYHLTIELLCSRMIYYPLKMWGNTQFAFDLIYSYLIFRNYRQGLFESGFLLK